MIKRIPQQKSGVISQNIEINKDNNNEVNKIQSNNDKYIKAETDIIKKNT